MSRPSVFRPPSLVLTLVAFALVVAAAVWLNAVMGLVLAVGRGVWLARHLARPLARLTQATRTYAQGQWTAEISAASVRELQALSQALSAMAGAIQRQIQELTTERNQATAILESMAEGVIALDAAGTILTMNPAAAAFFSAHPVRDKGRPLLEAVRHHELDELAHQALVERRPLVRPITVLRPIERILQVSAVPCEGVQPAGPCLVLVIQDQTELHKYDRLRREFVANVSHELKTPLTAIRSLTETLLDGALQDAANNRRLVELMSEEAARLDRLIDDLLQLAQIESEPTPPAPQAASLADVLQELASSLQPALAKRQLMLSIEVDPSWRVLIAPDRLRQVLLNLLDNAMKYNREGGRITVRAHVEDGMLRVSVEDTGIGIPEPDLPRVFERFYRVDKARSRQLGGTGLGLSIVKHLVEAYGGRVTVTSQLNHGSTFSFTVPLAV